VQPGQAGDDIIEIAGGPDEVDVVQTDDDCFAPSGKQGAEPVIEGVKRYAAGRDLGA